MVAAGVAAKLWSCWIFFTKSFNGVTIVQVELDGVQLLPMSRLVEVVVKSYTVVVVKLCVSYSVSVVGVPIHYDTTNSVESKSRKLLNTVRAHTCDAPVEV